MTKEPDLATVAGRLANILGEDDYLLVGAMAVGAHGYVRATTDVDFVVKRRLAEVGERLKEHGIPAVLRRENVLEGDFPCLMGALDGIRFDIMPPLVPLDWDRAIDVPLTGESSVRVVDLDGLIRLKLRAQGPKDLLDVAALVLKHPDKRGIAREVAAAYRVADKLAIWLNDPRLKAEVAGGEPPPTRR
jgi:hypothetical protein